MLRATCMNIKVRCPRGWQLTATNNRESRETENRTRAKKGSNRCVVDLFENEIADQINRLFKTARDVVRNVSCDGESLVPAKVVIETRGKLTELQDQLEVLKAKLREKYSEYVQAERERLGGLFDESKYRPVDVVVRETRIIVSIEPLGSHEAAVYNDCFTAEEADQLKADAMSADVDRENAVRETLTNRLREAIDDVGGVIKRYHDGGKRFTLGQPAKLANEAEIVAKINILDDRTIADACSALKIACIVGDDVRDKVTGHAFLDELRGIRRALLGQSAIDDVPAIAPAIDDVPAIAPAIDDVPAIDAPTMDAESFDSFLDEMITTIG